MQKFVGAVAFSLLPGLAFAEASAASSHALLHPQAALLLAASSSAPMAQSIDEQPVYKKRFLTANKVHKYLGLGSLLSATLAVLSPKEDDTSGPHHIFANGAAYLGAGAVATGLGFHYQDLQLSNGLKDPDNLHALLGTVGTLGYFAAVDEAPEDAHASYGMVGWASMAVAIKLTW